MKKIKEFFLEESKVNKGHMVLIGVDEEGQKWVLCTSVIDVNYCVKYEDAFDTKH